MNPLGQHMVDDHEQINRLLRHSATMLRAGMRDLALGLLQNFDEELQHHMRLEETKIFAPFLQQTGDPDGAIATMLRQHADVNMRLAELMELIRTDAPADVTSDRFEALERLLQEHTDFEEQTLYAFASQMAERRRAETAC